MIVLSPTTSAQEFSILPRDPDLLTGHSLVIVEEDSKNSETITDATYFIDGNKVCVSAAFSILNENRLYKISITDEDGNNWWRGKARCTAQTDHTLKHDNNTTADTAYIVLTDDETFTTLL